MPALLRQVVIDGDRVHVMPGQFESRVMIDGDEWTGRVVAVHFHADSVWIPPVGDTAPGFWTTGLVRALLTLAPGIDPPD
jgi:hypothetical protein